jgi:hypothetical protein
MDAMKKINSMLRARFYPSSDTILLGDGSNLEPLAPSQLEFIKLHFKLPKFFLLGYPRSGTTLLARLIRLHPEIHCNWQAQFFSQRGPIPVITSERFQHWLIHPSNHWLDDVDQTATFLRVYCDFVLEQGAQAAGKIIVGDKSPNDNGAQAVHWLAAIYPDARLVYLIRDGRDAVFSKRVQAMIDQPQNLLPQDRRIREQLLADPDPFLNQERSFFSKRWLIEASKQWANDVHQCVNVAQQRFGNKLLVMRYEDLILEPYEQMETAYTFLGASAARDSLAESIRSELASNPAAEWHENTGHEFVRRIPRGIHGIWQQVYTSDDIRIFMQNAGGVLGEFGYG